MHELRLFEEECENFFNSFTYDGETISVRDILKVVPLCGLSLLDPPLMRVLALLDDTGIETLTLADVNTLFNASGRLSEEDRLSVFIDKEADLPADLTFKQFLERTN
jgi:hypothetical protein